MSSAYAHYLEANMQKKIPVFFLVNTTGLFDELFRLAKLLLSSDVEPTFYFTFPHWSVDRAIERCKAAGFGYLTEDPIPTPAPTSILFPHLTRMREYFVKRPSWPFSAFLCDVLAEMIDLKLSIARANKFFSMTNAQLLIFSVDLVGYDSSAYVKAIHRRGKKALIVSSIMSNGLDVAEVNFHNPKFHIVSRLDRAIANIFPKWVIKHRGRLLFRVQPHRIVAMELLRLEPSKPWLFNGTHAEYVTMESQAMADYSAAAGMPRSKMRVVGSTADDVLAETAAHYEARRSELCRSLGLRPDRPIILTALPPDFLYVDGGRPECDFSDYGSLVEFWVRSLSAVKGYNVIIALHPSAKADDMRPLERYGARISTLITPELVPLCTFFVASISSTIRWAIACGKPVLNYDVYRYRYDDDFGKVAGVFTVEDQEHFLAALKRFAEDKSFFSEMQEKQCAVSKRWGFVDGQCGKRIVALVDEILPK